MSVTIRSPGRKLTEHVVCDTGFLCNLPKRHGSQGPSRWSLVILNPTVFLTVCRSLHSEVWAVRWWAKEIEIGLELGFLSSVVFAVWLLLIALRGVDGMQR